MPLLSIRIIKRITRSSPMRCRKNLINHSWFTWSNDMPTWYPSQQPVWKQTDWGWSGWPRPPPLWPAISSHIFVPFASRFPPGSGGLPKGYPGTHSGVCNQPLCRTATAKQNKTLIWRCFRVAWPRQAIGNLSWKRGRDMNDHCCFNLLSIEILFSLALFICIQYDNNISFTQSSIRNSSHWQSEQYSLQY